MYQNPHYREDRLEVLHALIREHPFATLVAFGQDGLIANHLPLVLDVTDEAQGVLRGHVARANPLWRDVDPSVEVVAVFQGADSYITPSWYPSKKEHGKVVPTWNYAVVHAHGPLHVKDDKAWLKDHLVALTGQQEAPRPVPWRLDDAPDDFIERQFRGIVGLELPISRIEGKWKVSQNKQEADRTGVARGLNLEGDGPAQAMAELIVDHGQRDQS